MKKVSVIALYKEKSLLKLTVNYKNSLTELMSAAKTFDNIHQMQNTILTILKNNNMYCGYYCTFGAKFYDINFVNIDTLSVDKMAFVE